MGDLTEITGAGSTKIIGSDLTGVETNPVNADSSGNLYVKTTSAGPVAPGTVAGASELIGGQYNTSLPTLTNGQQSAIQVDSNGKIIISPLSVGSADKTVFTYGTSIQQTIGGVYQDTSPALTAGTEGAVRLTANRAFHVNIRDSSGNEKLGSSLSAASIPVVVASDQSAISTKLDDGMGNLITSTSVGGKRPLDIVLVGNSDGTRIGNSTDRLKVDIGNFLPPSLSYDDMNVANGGIARGTLITTGTTNTLYSYSGAGVMFGFVLNLAALTAGSGWSIDLELDGTKVFGTNGILTTDLNLNTVYDIGAIAGDFNSAIGFSIVDKALRWIVPNGGLIKFTTSVVLKVTNNGTGGASQKFNAGLMLLLKGTI